MYREKIKIKPYAYRILPAQFQEIGKYYIDTLDADKTAELFGVDLDKVNRIVELLERYSGGPHHTVNKQLRDYLE